MKNLAPFTDPITLCRNITSYNVIRGWDVAKFKHLMVPRMTAYFLQLPNVLGHCTSPPDIINLVKDADPALRIARNIN